MDNYLGVLKKYFVFDGRARRREYWMFFLVNLIITVVLSFLESAIGLDSVLTSIYGLAVLLPSLGVAVRRLHDTERSGWWVLIGLVPIIGTIVLIVFLAMDSKPGSNKYGPNPKEGASTETHSHTPTPPPAELPTV